GRLHRGSARRVVFGVAGGVLWPEAGRLVLIAEAAIARRRVRVDRHLAVEERYGFGPPGLAEIAQAEALPLPGAHRNAALKIRQGERALPITAVGHAENAEQRRVLRDGQQLAVALCPALWREVERELSNLTNEGIRHDPRLRLVLRRKDAEQRDDEVDHQERLHVVV